MKKPDRLHQVLIISLLIVLILVGVTIAVFDWREVERSIDQANWKLMPLAITFTVFSYAFLSYSFVVVNRIFGILMDRRDLFEIGFVSMAMSRLVPAIGGYSVRLLLMNRRGIAVADIVAASVFHTYFNNLVVVSLLPMGLFYLLVSHPLTQGEAVGLALAAVLLVLAIILATILVFGRSTRVVVLRVLNRVGMLLTRRRIGSHLRAFDTTLNYGVAKIRKRPRLIILLVAQIAGNWLAAVAVLGFCFYALGVSIGYGVLLTGFAVGITAGTLSMIPGGLGVQEGSMAGIYALLGVSFEQALMASILFRVVYYFIPFFISLGFYPRLLRGTGRKGSLIPR
ncbi:MAG: flippase-like domain-containing protein [Dehalococcoidia bacterium]|nr:flippase-like domain-containing protein [Dehalococcoidia bacterium]